MTIRPLLVLAFVGALLAGCEDVEQTADCAAYVDCVRAIDAQEGVQTNAARYEAEGDCWGSPEGAELCDRSCDKGMVWMRARVANLPEACQ